MSRRNKMLLGVGALVLAVSLALGSVAFAADSTPQSATSPQATETPQNTGKGPTLVESFLDKLAANLGIGKDKLQSALKTTSNQMVDEAVQQGKITKERGDALKQRIDQGNGLPFLGLKGKAERRGFAHGWQNGARFGDVAGFLGITPAQLQQELQPGTSLAQVAAKHGKSRAELIQYLHNQTKTSLDQAVKNGKLTQAQEDKILSNLDSRLGQFVDSTGVHWRGGKAPFRKGSSGPNATPTAGSNS